MIDRSTIPVGTTSPAGRIERSAIPAGIPQGAFAPQESPRERNDFCLFTTTAIIRRTKMAWEWSHTVEAYQNARENLATLSPERLAETWAEWRAIANPENHAGGFNANRYEKALRVARKRIRRGNRELIESDIFSSMSDSISVAGKWYGRTSDNGGFNAWACPFGCGCHTVSFDGAED